MDLSADLFVTPNEAPTRRTGVFLAAQGNGPHKQGDPREGGMGESANKATIAYRDDQYKVVMNSAYCTVGDTKYANASCDCESTCINCKLSGTEITGTEMILLAMLFTMSFTV